MNDNNLNFIRVTKHLYLETHMENTLNELITKLVFKWKIL